MSMSAQAKHICDHGVKKTMDQLDEYDRRWNKEYHPIAVKLGYIRAEDPYDVMENLTWWQIVNVEEYEEPEDPESDSNNMFDGLYSSDEED